MSGPLNGITVLDMSRFIAGPHCSMLLGDMGADVIKVERRGRGEDSRGQGPYKEVDGKSVSLYFTQYNKNKRSLSVDFYNPESIALLKKLAAKADVLVENFRPGTLDKMGLSPETLHAINPKLVITSISGFGQQGTFKDRAAFDCIGQAVGGLMSISGDMDGEPMLSGTWVGDFVTAIYAAFGTVCALHHVQGGGKGQHLDLSLVECVTSILATVIPDYAANGVIQQPTGNRDSVCAPANMFRCKDGPVYLHGGTDALFKRLAPMMGQPQLLQDPRFSEQQTRLEHAADIEVIVQKWIIDYTRDEAEQMFADAGIPFGKIANVVDILQNPLFKERETVVYRDFPGVGEIALPGVVVKMSETPGEVRHRPPMVGEHNHEILAEYLGMSRADVDALAEKGVL